MVRRTRVLLLAGASALAILAGATCAQADTFTIPGVYIFTAPSTGTYMVDVWGAQGGASSAFSGGLGAGVGVDVALTAGEEVEIFVGAHGGYGPAAGGGGGSSAALFYFGPVVAGAGGGGGFFGGGGNGVAPAPGGPGAPGYGGGGAGGFMGTPGQYSQGAPGGGIGGYYGPFAGKGYLDGGAGGSGFGNGGYGGAGFSGGGGGYLGGGGGGGISGGGGGYLGYGGGGGGSYSFGPPTQSLAFQSGDGEVSINAVPEPSTWVMALAGFAGLGWLARMRRRKLTPA